MVRRSAMSVLERLRKRLVQRRGGTPLLDWYLLQDAVFELDQCRYEISRLTQTVEQLDSGMDYVEQQLGNVRVERDDLALMLEEKTQQAQEGKGGDS